MLLVVAKDRANRDPSVRIRRATFDTLQRVISESGWPQVDLLDQAILRLADYFDAHGKTLLMPLNYSRTYRVFEIQIDATGGTVTQERPRQMILDEQPVEPKLTRTAGANKTSTRKR